MMVLKGKTECWYTVLHMETHSLHSFTSLYILYIALFSFHVTFSDRKKRAFKTRIKRHCVSHPVRPHTNRKHLFTDVELSAATLALKEKVSEKGNPHVNQSAFTREQNVSYFQTDKETLDQYSFHCERK